MFIHTITIPEYSYLSSALCIHSYNCLYVYVSVFLYIYIYIYIYVYIHFSSRGVIKDWSDGEFHKTLTTASYGMGVDAKEEALQRKHCSLYVLRI